MSSLNPKSEQRLNFLIAVFYYAVIAVLVYLSVTYVLNWVLPFILAFCIVTLIHPMIVRIEKKLPFKKEIVSVAVMLIIYLLVGALLFFLILQLVFFIQDILVMLQGYYKDTIYPSLINRDITGVFPFLNQLPPELINYIYSFQDSIANAVQSFAVNLFSNGFDWFTRFSAGLPAIFIGFAFTIMLSFFISMQYSKVIALFGRVLPKRAKMVVKDLRFVVIDSLFRYLKACFKLMIITFVELSVGLMVLRAPNAIPIAAGIALFDALPVFGTGAIMIPWVIFELVQGHYSFALGLGVLYAIVTVVRNIIEPKIVGDKLGLNPIVSLVSIYFGFRIWGVFGMICMPILTQITLELCRKANLPLFQRILGRRRTAEKPETQE